MACVRSIGGEQRRPLDSGWELSRLPAGKARTPAELDAAAPVWFPANVPGTAAAALQKAGEPAGNLDAADVWYRLRFTLEGDRPRALGLSRLATLAQVFLDGAEVLRSDNAFLDHQIDLSAGPGAHELHLRFASLDAALREKRPRPRWKVRLVAEQRLRHFRTTLLGRNPGWSAPLGPVGPLGGVELVERGPLRVLRSSVRAAVEGNDGVLHADLEVRPEGGRAPRTALLRSGALEQALACAPAGEGRFTLRGQLRLPGVERWWPHALGRQALHPVEVLVDGVRVDLGRTGFRTLELQRDGGRRALLVNGVRVFCGGALWVPDLLAPEQDPRPSVLAAREAGMAMLRLPGDGSYGDARFFDACDELGVLVWQDFMFANLDYPADDAFLASVREEALQLLSLSQLSPGLATLAGSSDLVQQVSFLGLDGALAEGPIFDGLLPELCTAARPDVPYLPCSTETIRASQGFSHYYGVGGYQHALPAARRADVSFATECLAMSNVPDEETFASFLSPIDTPPTAPSWKAAVPRDGGTGWDHEDVRDHYLRTLFGADPELLRRVDVDRWLALSRVVTGELIAGVIAELRAGGRCGGALLLGLRDSRPGCGFGLLDSRGRPKAAYWYARRAFSPVALFAIDEGQNGLRLHAANDTRTALEVELRLSLFRDGEVRVGEGKRKLTLGPGAAVDTDADELLGRFSDASWAFRFGPVPYGVATAELVDAATGSRLAEAFYFPAGLPAAVEPDVGLSLGAAPAADGGFAVTVRTRRFAQSVAIAADGFSASDDFFHLAPGGSKTIALTRTGGGRPGLLQARPLNSAAVARLKLEGA